MSAASLGCLLLATFFGLELLATRIPKRVRLLPLALFALALGVGAVELARYDHGHGDWVLWIAFVFAPVIVIFGGASAGVRKWYGWPDFGPIPGRLAAVAGTLLLGVLVGTQIKASDVELTRARGETLRRAVLAWRDAHAGAWPTTLSEAVPDVPTTRLGGFAPPPFVYDATKRELRFPMSTDLDARNDLTTKDSKWERAKR